MSLSKLLLEEVNEQEKKNIFHKNVATVQRGEPEQIMLKAQKTMGGGVLSWTVEHIGDLTHRMSEKVTYEEGGYEFVKPKVERAVRLLSSDYGFEREFKENIRDNAEFYDKTEQQLMSDVKSIMKKYADAHRKVEVYNKMQWLARQSAIELGELNFDKALKHLKELKTHLDKGQEHWVEVAHEFNKEKDEFN